MSFAVFTPRLHLIDTISNAQQAVVTFEEDHTYVDNQIVSFRVSKPYGMYEINNKQAKVLSHTNDTITVDIDTTNFSAFSVPSSLWGTTPPCAVPSCSGVNEDVYTPYYILDDCFDFVRG